MAIKMTDREWCGIECDYRCSFIMDDAADAANLPKCAAGSTALVAKSGGALYIVNASGAWVEV